MTGYLLLKWLHVVSSTLLLGTGLGIAFFMWRAHRTRDARVIAAVSADVVRADFLFTATAVLVQPVTGFLLIHRLGYPLSAPWLHWSLALYVVIGCCWLPVVWLQVQMRNLARRALQEGTPLPEAYYHYFRFWFLLGWPAFAGVLLVFWLMVAKPG